MSAVSSGQVKPAILGKFDSAEQNAILSATAMPNCARFCSLVSPSTGEPILRPLSVDFGMMKSGACSAE